LKSVRLVSVGITAVECYSLHLTLYFLVYRVLLVIKIYIYI